MKFGKIDQYLLLGGGQTLFNLARHLTETKRVCRVVISQMHATGLVDVDSVQVPLEDALGAQNIDFHISLNIEQDERIDAFLTSQTLGISLGAPWIFRPKFIRRFDGRLVNLHGQLLPKDRGGGGYSWLILSGQRRSGCVLHLIDAGIDSGKIVRYSEFFFPSECRKPIAYQNFANIEKIALLKAFVEEVENEQDFQMIDQVDYLSTYWPRLNTDAQAYINWEWSAREIENFVCAFDDPYDGVATFINGQKVQIKDCFSESDGPTFHPFQYGVVYRKSNNTLFIAARGGTLVAHRVFVKGSKSKLPKIRLGDRFYTPQNVLDDVKQFRAFYNSQGLKKT